MGSISTLIWFVAFLAGGAALLVVLLLVARARYINSGQEEGE